MKNLLTSLGSLGIVLASASVAFANEPGGGYEGISTMYYTIIALVLGYGVYDTFFKKS
ncbi:MAG: hypothetical protein ACREI3_12170 [Nitrospirales bacterium]